MTGESVPIGTAPTLPIGLEYGGPHMDLFVLQRQGLSKMNRQNEWTADVRFETPVEAEVYDPLRKQIIVGGGDGLHTLDGETLDILRQQSFREMLGTGRLFLKISPDSGELLAMRRGDPTMLRFRRARDGSFKLYRSFELTGVPSPDSFDLNGDNVFVASAGHVRQFKVDGREVRNSPFAGSPCGDLLNFGKNFSDWTPEDYPAESWYDIDNPEIPLP